MGATIYSFIDSKENIYNTHQVLHFLSEPPLSFAYNIGGLRNISVLQYLEVLPIRLTDVSQ